MPKPKNLAKMRKNINVSVQEIANAADLHPQTVYRVLKNQGASRNSINRVMKVLTEMHLSNSGGGGL